MEFTALGDNINLTSRLESVNKYYGTYICVSEKVYLSAKDFFNFRYLDTIQVQGKDVPVKIYELVEKFRELTFEEQQLESSFMDGVNLYSS